jgi:hypothetical protein
MTDIPKSVVIDAASTFESERFCFCGVTFLAAAAALEGAALNEDLAGAALEGDAFAGADCAFCGRLAADDAFFSEVLGVAAAVSAASPSSKGRVVLAAECPSLDSMAFLNTNLIDAARASAEAQPLEDWGSMHYDNPKK